MVFPWYVDAVKKRGRGFTLWEGTNVDSVIHVRDLAAAFVLLVEEALKEGGGGADWGEEGWYYVEGGEYVFREMAGEIVKGMMKKGWIEREGVNEIKIEEAKELHSYAELLWGITMRVNGERIRDLGWSAKEESVFESIPELLSDYGGLMRGVEGYVHLDIAMHYLDSASFHFARNTTRSKKGSSPTSR